MSLVLTFWEDPNHKNTEDDFDELFHVRLKTVKQIPDFVANRPERCTMVSVEHSEFRLLGCGRRTNFWKIVWQTGMPYPVRKEVCPLCGRSIL